MNRCNLPLILLASLLALGQTAYSGITMGSYWRMGEGFGSGTDEINADGAFNPLNNAAATTATASPATAAGSIAYQHVTGSGSGLWMFGAGATPQTVPTDNWGVQFNVRLTTLPASGNFAAVFGMAEGTSGGMVIEAANVGGTVYFDVNKQATANYIIPRTTTTQVTVNTWYNLALVKSGGTTYFYVNGVLAGSNAGAITVDGRLGFGLDQNYGTHRMIGDFDEARFFTFTAGQFNAAVDLSMTLRTVTYSGSGSDGGTVPADGAGYFPGTSVTTLGAGTMTRSGFAFAGWNTAAGGGGTAYGPAATFSSPDANTTLYAQWTPVSVTATPSFDPVAGGYVGARTATISSDAGSTIYYTTDGSAPAPSSAHGPSPITGISIPTDSTMILQAYAAKPGYTDSPVATAVYHTITTPVWTNVAGGSWADAVNWQSTVIAGGGGVSADFGALDLTADGAVTLDGARTIGNLIFGDTTPSHDWTLNSGTGGPLTLAAGASPVITVNNRKVTIGAELAGTGGFAKNGNGTLTLAAVNTYTGNIAVNSGTLECDAFAGTTSSTVGANATGRTLTVSPGATLVSNTTDAVDFQSTVANNLAFVIQGVWNNNPAEAATGFQRVDNLTLQGGTINDYGQHAFNYGGILMANTVTVAGSAPSAYNQSGGGVGMGILNPTTFNVADVTGDADTDFIVNGLIRATAVNGQIGSLAKTGAGTMSISGACTYGGATTVNGGTFQVNGSLATGSVTVGVAGTLAGTGTIGGAVTVAGALHPGTTDIGVLTINNTLTLQAGSTTSMRIDKTGGLTTSDELFASTVNYGGALTVTATGEALAAGDTFFLFTANTRNGGFTTVDLPALAAPLTWDSSGLATDGTIRVVDTLPTPTFSPVAGGYVGGQTITITCTEPGTTIFYTYTTDETTPADPTIVSDSGTPGASTASVIVPVGTVKFIKAMAVKFGSVNSPVAQADFRTVATPVWIYDGSGIWSDDTNWQTGAIAQGAGVTADFSTLALTTSPTVALDSARTIGSLVFGDVGDSNGWSLNASGGSVLTLDNGASPSVITVANQTTTISASLLCLQGLTKAGGGTLAFTGLATGSAMDLSVENGTLRLARFSDGSATYGLPYDTAGGLANGGVITINPTATLIVANAYNLGHAQQIHINGGTLAITNSAGGDGQNYTLNLNFTGGGTINGPGSLRWGEMADATLTVNGVAPATINSDLWTISTNNKGGTIHIADPAGVLNFNGAIKPHTYSPAGGPVPLTKTGPGTLILAGTNTYTGATAVNGGTLTVSGSLGATEVTVANGAALGGNGNLGGTLTVHSGGRHTLAVAAAPGAQITRIIAGALTLDAGNILDLTATVTPGAGTYTLVTAGGGIAGTPTTVNLPVGVSGIVAVDGNDLVLTVSTAGGYDSWQDANGTTGTASADHDNDGVPNGVEYFIGGGNDTTGFTALPGVVNISGVRTVTYTRDRGYVGTYGTDFVIETSETLDGAWTPETIGGTVIQSGDNFTYSFPPVGPGRKFVRLSITVP